MNRGADHFIGTHDFTSFCAAGTEIENKTRTIYEAQWDRSGQEWVFRIRGNGFLQYMVRTISGTLVQIGRGRLSVDQLAEIFAAKDRRMAGPSLPAHGLHLVEVEY
jgi:tRNA pseudouridine38-40 synthase